MHIRTPFVAARYLLATACVALALSNIGKVSTAKAEDTYNHSGWIRQNAVQVAIAFMVEIEPHYGAFFYSAHTPYDQHYSGTGGDTATLPYGGISAWNWWGGPPSSTLLLPKRWLGTEILTGGEKMTPSKYNAMCAR